MIRFLLRSLGFVLLAGAFVGLVVDGARSIADDAFGYTSLADLALAVARERWTALQPLVESGLPAAWTYGIAPLSRLPVVAVALVFGVLCLRLGQPPREPIGFLARR